jgi:glycosyltransferase involved in cell wall biosynthesis
LYDRQKVRAEFGYGDADRVLLFLGTPREHKGVFEVADALERLGDRRLALCVIGSIHDKRVFKRFASYKAARIALHLDQPWHRLPELVSMADAIAILQDPKHPIAEFQMPAKLSDGLALNVPVIASPVPPLQDVALSGAFQTVATAAELDAALQRLATSPPRKNDSDQGRQLFLSEFSYGVNCARLELAITTAAASPRTELPRFEQLFRLLQQRTGTALPHLVTTPPRRERRTAVRPGDPPRDLVFLWKQNDSDLYGRRSDMLCKYLLRSGKVRRIVHFDAPISAAALEQQAAAAAAEPAHQGKLIYVNTIRRVLQAADTPAMVRRTFLHRSGNRPERAMGKDLPPLSAYPDFVRQVLRDLQVDEAPVLWVSPVVMDYPAIADVIRPAFIVADVIDDQRTFPGSSEAHRQQLAAAYATILGEADAVFTNCIPVSEAFCALRPDIHVVPNGAELHAEAVNWEEPPELAGLPRPIIGYVGNLRDRIDLGLIEALARAYPQGTILLIGSAHGRPEVPALAARLPNIRLLGVKPSEEAQRIMRGFDVAIMPHLQNEQSERMNPLKLYVYFAVGVPVVTTEVANIGDLASYVNVAADKDAFLAAIARVLAGEGKAVDKAARRQVLAKVSWEARVSELWRCIEQA